MKTYSFENMLAWGKAKELTLIFYRLTNKFPRTEQFGLISQMTRAAVSVISNLAEGSARRSDKDKARFYEIAYGSTIEVLSQSIVSSELGFILQADYEEIRSKVDEVCFLISQLRKPLINVANEDGAIEGEDYFVV